METAASHRVLVVDDDGPVRVLLRESLTAEGYEVELAGTGRQGQEALRGKAFDVVILDLNLPDIPGEQFLSEAPKDGEGPAFILITGHASTESAIKAVQHAAFDYIRKPFQLSDLLSSVRNAAQKSRLKRENERLIAALQAHQRDLSARVQQATQELREKNRLLAAQMSRTLAILQSLGEAVVTCRSDGTVDSLNQTAARLLRLREQQGTGQAWHAMAGIAPEQCHVRRTVESGVGLEGLEETLHRSDGKEVPVRLSTSVFRDESGSPLGVAVCFRDVSQERQLQRMKSEFITGASHELRTPLTSIRGYTELLLSGGAGAISAPQRECLEALDRNSERLAQLVAAIIDLSRIEGGVFDVSVEETDVVAIGRAATQRTGREAEAYGVGVEFNGPAESIVTQSDPRRLRQVIEELLDNALRHTPTGGRIETTVWQEDGGFAIRVADNGVGIVREQLGRIFEPLQKIEGSAVRGGDGVGLGLAVVRAIVTQLGGRIQVESSLGEGSTFTVSFPLPGREPQSAAGQAKRSG
jgi:PAS domain S-box-containing protein